MNYIAFWARGMMADLNPLITRAKPGYDALMLDVYNSWKGKTPS